MPYQLKTVRGHRSRIKHQLYRVRIYAEGLTADWDGTFWKNKKEVKESLHIARGGIKQAL